MCLIAHRNSRTNIPNDVIEYNSKVNPDGFGIAWRDENKLEYRKFASGEDEFHHFREILKNVDKDKEVEYVAHFRKATHGANSKDLAHPFLYEDKEIGPVLVFHNGIISIETGPNESDTSVFVQTVLATLESEWWLNPTLLWLVEEAIGYSRLLIMTQKRTIKINQRLWDVQNKIWYSCTPIPKFKGTGGRKVFEDITIPYSAKYSDDFHIDPLLNDDSEEREEDIVVTTKEGWYHQGHFCVPLSVEKDDKSEERFGNVLCVACKTEGEYYVIDGKTYLDIAHKVYSVENDYLRR